MRDATPIALLQARVADLERKLGWVEQRITGELPVSPSLQDLTTLYVQACKPETPTPQLVQLWTIPILSLGAEQFFQMARLMRDPFAWKPFLAMLMHYQASGYEVRHLLQHVWDRGQEVLDLQGLSLLRPGDVMGYPTRIQEAIGAISS